jgi:hypothetical protein
VKWINVADQKPPLNERVMVYVDGRIRVGLYHEVYFSVTEQQAPEVNEFIDKYCYKSENPPDGKANIYVSPQQRFNWSIDGEMYGWNVPKPSYWMTLPYEPRESGRCWMCKDHNTEQVAKL